jgi:phosphate starvation-inducible PhoH-like protein
MRRKNSTTEQMFMFLTRLGGNSRQSSTGDETQIDLPRIGTRVARGASRAAHIEECPISSSPGVMWCAIPWFKRIIAAYEEHRGKSGRTVNNSVTVRKSHKGRRIDTRLLRKIALALMGKLLELRLL